MAENHRVDRDEYAKQLRQRLTESESILWFHLRGRRCCGEKFRRQHPIGPFIVDFYCAARQLVIECDGCDHRTKEGKEYDARRDAWLESQGIRVLRFTNTQIENDVFAVLKEIEAFVDAGES